MKPSTENISKAKIKRQEKLVQTAWQQANMPKGSMQLENAIMYLQNSLVTIQNEISNEQRYTLLYKFIAKAHIHHMQTWYNEAVAKSNDGSDLVSGDSEQSSQLKNASNRDNNEESKTAGKQALATGGSSSTSKTYGDDGYKYPQLEFPASHDDLAAYNASVKSRIETKYETLTKNIHFYLTYLFLETGDYRSAIRHGETVLRLYGGNDSRLTKKTHFTVMQYLSEAYCMLGQHQKAIQTLDEAEQVMEAGRARTDEETKLTVEMLTDKLVHGDKLSTKTIVQMNKAAIMLC